MQKIASAFIKAKRAFGPVLKDKNNPHFKSKYADLESCLAAVDDACLTNGIALYQETSDDAAGVTVETVFLHESGETLRCGKLHVPAAKQDPQGYGSALTYARRYSLLAACGIAAEDDDGNAASRSQQPAAKLAHSKGNERLPNTAERLAGELSEAIAGDLTLTVVEKYGAICEDSTELADAVWSRLSSKERSYVTRALNDANKQAA